MKVVVSFGRGFFFLGNVLGFARDAVVDVDVFVAATEALEHADPTGARGCGVVVAV